MAAIRCFLEASRGRRPDGVSTALVDSTSSERGTESRISRPISRSASPPV
jgi:hypothetical protein